MAMTQFRLNGKFGDWKKRTIGFQPSYMAHMGAFIIDPTVPHSPTVLLP